MEISRKPTWEEVERWAFKLAEKIGDYKPDFVIGISRGGLIPAILLSRIKGGLFLPIYVEKIGEERRVSALCTLISSTLIGKNVLLVEDVLETGRSLIVAREFLERNGARVKTACFFARDLSEVKPDYVIVEGLTYEIILEIIFPWERLKVSEVKS